MKESKKLIPFIEKKGENEIRVERLFNMFLRISGRDGYSKGEDWFKLMYTYLPRDEREKMNDNITNIVGLKNPSASEDKERMKKAKDLVGSLRKFAEEGDNYNKRAYSPLELNKEYLKIQADLEIKNEAFKLWKKREIELGKSSLEGWFLGMFEEMDDRERDKWKNRIERRQNAGGKPEDTRLLMTTIFDIEEGERRTNSVLDNICNSLGRNKAKEMEKKEGVATVFLKDRKASVKSQLNSWYLYMPSNDRIEEEVEMTRAKEEYFKRIIVELQGRDRRKQKV